MGMFCDCGHLIVGNPKVQAGGRTCYYCRSCNTYYDNKFEKVPKSVYDEIWREEQLEEDRFPFNRDAMLKENSDRYYLYDYLPSPRVSNDEQMKWHDHILNIKDNEEYARQHIYPILRRILKERDYVISIVPSSNRGGYHPALKNCLKSLCTGRIIDGTDCLNRTHNIPKKHLGGIRDSEVEKESLKVEKREIIMGKVVVLFDDITTTGSSLLAGSEMLIEAGAKKVYMFAIAKTSDYY